jgi:hypothetical protein
VRWGKRKKRVQPEPVYCLEAWSPQSKDEGMPAGGGDLETPLNEEEVIAIRA